MKKKQIVDLIIALILILSGSILLVFPLVKIVNIKFVVILILSIYCIANLIQFILTRKDKDYEGLLTSIASLITIIVALKCNINKVPWQLALTLFIWIIMMSLIKLKKADYYNDRKKDIWILKIITLILFILTGLLTTVNLYYTEDVQVLVLGYFFLIHGILELIDPITIFLIEKK